MNYYERYCGDYGRDTAHLMLVEHGAYTVMLDAYYSNERPLPSSFEALYRICRAMNESEQAAVRSVADQYFPLGQDGLRHNARADRELAKGMARIERSRVNGTLGDPRFRLEPTGPPSGPPSSAPYQGPNGGSAGPPSPQATSHTPYPNPNPNPRKVKVKVSCANAAAFDAFWSLYPKRRSRGQAEKAWEKLNPNAELIMRIMASLAKARRSRDWLKDGGDFIPHPATWLNAKGWEDDVEPDPDGREVV